MNFKVTAIGYYALMLVYIAVFMGWTALMVLFLPRDASEFRACVGYLLVLEGVFFACSPFLQRTVTVTKDCVTDQWLFFAVRRIPAAAIADSGICVSYLAGYARQFVFLSTEPLSDEQVVKYFDGQRPKGFIVIEYPQDELDACISELVENYGIPYREINNPVSK